MNLPRTCRKHWCAQSLSTSNEELLNQTRELDTKHYWDLTKHIFRYSHLNTKDGYNGAHTVNEGAWCGVSGSSVLEANTTFSH